MALQKGSSSDHAKQDAEEVHVQVQDRHVQAPVDQRQTLKLKQRKWWISVLVCTAFVLIGRSLVTLLQNFYYVQSGRGVCDDPKQFKGTWIQAIAQNAAFPITATLLIILLSRPRRLSSNPLGFTESQPPPPSSSSFFGVLLLYIILGVLFAAYSELYMIGKTRAYFFTWIFATQLIFTPIFAALINKHRFNRWIIISIILSIVATVIGPSDDAYYPCEDESNTMSIGAWCAFFGSVAFSLSLCVMQLGFKRIIKNTDNIYDSKKGFSAVLMMQTNVSIIATLICLVGLFVSGEHKDLKGDFETFEKGKAYYILSLVGLSLSWQLWSVGLMGLVFFTSCIFSNVANLCASPVVYILVVLAFRFMDDEIEWLKGGALLAGILGLASYVYSLFKSKKKEMRQASPAEGNR